MKWGGKKSHPHTCQFIVGSSRLCVIIFAYVRLNAYWARLLGLF
ncbi:hypothetical protein VL20_1354 [Microcystis panniformis FACHB-1757]|uniref:Uncharacterized protein n=1 Tax=Microcystis panniformis FACHB-1757 TaxID=1638788 RepID=A0A0K1RXI6_9CHRO|nr:hypothetical protein VL20_1354 [Microcystis panniformis FACHB-1757]